MEEANETTVSMYKEIDLSDYGDIADQGNLQVRLSAYINSSTASTDTGRIDAVWIDKDGNVISTDTGSETDPSDVGTWSQVQETNTAPHSARKVRLTLVGTKVSGSALNVSWDNCTIEINEGTKQFLHFRAYQVSAQVGRGFASKIGIVEV
jgi:hypothetical protein